MLHIPSIGDRIIERALLRGLNPIIDPHLGASSYGYRPGLGVVDAVQAVVALRDEGLGWVLRSDIHDCFPSIDVTRVMRLLEAFIDDAVLLRLIDALLARCVVGGFRGRRVAPGLPQGSPLSPLFCNLVLTSFDDALRRAGFPMIRYADDFTVAARSRSAAEAALHVARTALKELDMALSEDKTQLMSFDEGFCFLGEDFGARYPPMVVDHRVEEAAAGKVVYVGRQGSRVRIQSGRLLVESKDNAELLNLPQSHVSRVVCFGSVGFSAGAHDWAFGSGTSVVFLSRRGSYSGQLLGGGKTRVSRLRCQLGVTAERSLTLGRRAIEGKLVKQGVLLRHFVRDDNAAEVSRAIGVIDAMAAMLPTASSTDEIMGLEGAAAKAYFDGLRAILPSELAFRGRNRQPPLDVVNAALSYGYTVLLGECTSALVAAGLDPAIGNLHSEAGNRPALALDLMEEFRPLIVDQVVVQLCRARSLTGKHGTTTAGKPGVLLTKAGKEALLGSYERRMLTRVRNASDFAGSWRRQLYRQAQRLAMGIAGDDLAYRGLSWR
ncbi:CRISPR-associated endonuclease Cas1 [Micropruina sp.]|uniref:CRISPR-associated endonuclease Cas1 n=1 Tax=Micropruina sp. TaxID=2737536 RepID=UPI0039E2BBE0